MKLYTRTASLYWITMARIYYDLRGVVILNINCVCVCIRECMCMYSPCIANRLSWSNETVLPLTIAWLFPCILIIHVDDYKCKHTIIANQISLSFEKTYNFNLIWPKKGTRISSTKYKHRSHASNSMNLLVCFFLILFFVVVVIFPTNSNKHVILYICFAPTHRRKRYTMIVGIQRHRRLTQRMYYQRNAKKKEQECAKHTQNQKTKTKIA